MHMNMAIRHPEKNEMFRLHFINFTDVDKPIFVEKRLTNKGVRFIVFQELFPVVQPFIYDFITSLYHL